MIEYDTIAEKTRKKLTGEWQEIRVLKTMVDYKPIKQGGLYE